MENGMTPGMIEVVKNAIEESEFNNLKYHLVDGVFIFLDPSWKRISLSISGGADSAAMAMVIGKIITDNNYDIEIHFMTMLRFTKTRPWQEYDARNVVEYFRKMYPSIKTVHHENYFPEELLAVTQKVHDETGKEQSAEGMAFKGWLHYMCARYDIQARITTTTQNPPEALPQVQDDVLSKAVPSRDRVFAPHQHGGIYQMIVQYNNVYLCQPLRFTDKRWTMLQYKNFGQEELLKITRSCEGSDSKYPEVYKGLDYTNYTPDKEVPECNICFWCHERHWGMNQVFGKLIK